MFTPYDSPALTAACTATVFKARILLFITYDHQMRGNTKVSTCMKTGWLSRATDSGFDIIYSSNVHKNVGDATGYMWLLILLPIRETRLIVCDNTAISRPKLCHQISVMP